MDNKIGLIGQIGFQNLSVCSLKDHSLRNTNLGLWEKPAAPHVRLASRQHGVQSSKGFLPQLNPCKIIMLTIAYKFLTPWFVINTLFFPFQEFSVVFFTCDPIIHLFTRSNFCPIFAPIPLCSHPLPNICDILFSMAPCFPFVCSPPFLSTLCSLVYPLPNVDNISGATMDKSGQMLLICQRLSRKREKTLREKLIKILTWQLCNLPSEGAIEKICVIGLL